MKVKNTVIFLGDNTSKDIRSGAIQKEAKQRERKNVFAGNLNEITDPIAQKRKEAQKKAMQVVSDAFKNERTVDEDLEKRSNHIEELRGQLKEANSQYQELEARKEELKELYGITEDNPNNSEYQERMEELNEQQKAFEEEMVQAQKGIKEEVAIIRGVQLERLKTHPMLDAAKQKEDILAAASDEIMRMLLEEGKEYLDKKAEENQEKAEKLQEDKEKQEEQTEAVKEKIEEMEALVEAGKNTNQANQADRTQLEESIYQMVELEEIKMDVQKEVESIVDKMALVIEDIKGACVDQKL